MKITSKVLMAVAVVTTAIAVAVPALTGAQATGGARDITVLMKFRGASQTQHSDRPKGDMLAPGDALTVRFAMFSADGAAVGTVYADCVNVGPKARSQKATLQCTQTYRFNDGQVVAQGVVNFSRLDGLAIPIVGGSGAYRSASGVLGAGKPVKGYDSVDILHLDG
jgi:hypothetical protein